MPSQKPATTAKGPSRRAPLYLMRSLRTSGENCLSNGFVRRVAASKSERPSTRTRWSSRRAMTSLSVPTWLRSPHELSLLEVGAEGADVAVVGDGAVH